MEGKKKNKKSFPRATVEETQTRGGVSENRIFPRFLCTDDRFKRKRVQHHHANFCTGQIGKASFACAVDIAKRESLLTWLEHKALNFAPAPSCFDASPLPSSPPLLSSPFHGPVTLYKYTINCQGITYKYLWGGVGHPVRGCYISSREEIIETNVSDVTKGGRSKPFQPLCSLRVFIHWIFTFPGDGSSILSIKRRIYFESDANVSPTKYPFGLFYRQIVLPRQTF